MTYGTEDKKEFIYMQVTKDKFEIPLAMANSVEELAEITGVHRVTVSRGFKRKGSGFIKVEIDRDNEVDFVEKSLIEKWAVFAYDAQEEYKLHGKSEKYFYITGIIKGIRLACNECFKTRASIPYVKERC